LKCQRVAHTDIFYFIPAIFSLRKSKKDNGTTDAKHKTNFNIKYMSVNVKPIADRVLVEPAQAETTTASGIIIPDTAKEKPQRGTVVAVGNGKKDEPMTVAVGDSVLYGKYSGTEISLDGKDYLIMRESDILAII
jgi:chaperonin GroES